MAAPVYSTLIASGAVTALVSTRVYEDAAPQDVAKPYITFSYSGGLTNNYLGDLPGIDNLVVQIEITALTAASRAAIMAAVIAALDPVANMVSQPMTIWEFETKTYRLMLEYSFWVGR